MRQRQQTPPPLAWMGLAWSVILTIPLVIALLAGCGGGGGGGPANSPQNNNPFAGNYLGTLQLSGSQVGRLSLNVQKTSQAQGTLSLNNSIGLAGAMIQSLKIDRGALAVGGRSATLMGTVDATSGAFGLEGNLSTGSSSMPVSISGALPSTNGPNSTITAKIGATTFTGVMAVASPGSATPTPGRPTPTPTQPGSISGTLRGNLSQTSANLNLTTIAPLQATAKAPGQLSGLTLTGAFDEGNGTTAATPLRAVLLNVHFLEQPHVGTTVQLASSDPASSTSNLVQYIESVNSDIKGYIAARGTLTVTALTANTLEFSLDNAKMIPGSFSFGQPQGSFTLNGTATLNIIRH